jgi:hypothetical protein
MKLWPLAMPTLKLKVSSDVSRLKELCCDLDTTFIDRNVGYLFPNLEIDYTPLLTP